MTKNILIFVSIMIGIMAFVIFITTRKYNRLLKQAEQMNLQLQNSKNS